MVKLLETVSTLKKNIFEIKTVEEITLFLFIMYNFINFKVLLSLPKGFNDSINY